MLSLHLISGGAAQGLVGQLESRFRLETGLEITATFGAVGLMRDKLLAGDKCDVVILTDALVSQLEQQGHVLPASGCALGVVRTGVAVKTGRPLPAVDSAAALAALLRASAGIYFPDPVKATAGIHFMKVLRALGLDDELAARLQPYRNGAAAMRAMAQSSDHDVVGCTQVTEILYAPGVRLAGVLPKEFELATTYTAAVCSRAQEPKAAATLVQLLVSDASRPLRMTGGFETA